MSNVDPILDKILKFNAPLCEEQLLHYVIRKFDSDEARKRNATIVSCPICHITGNEPNMRRWHFENCSQALLDCQECGQIIPRQGTKPTLYKQKKFCDRKCYMRSKRGTSPIIMTEEVKKKLSMIGVAQSDQRRIRCLQTKPWLKSGRWK